MTDCQRDPRKLHVQRKQGQLVRRARAILRSRGPGRRWANAQPLGDVDQVPKRQGREPQQARAGTCDVAELSRERKARMECASRVLGSLQVEGPWGIRKPAKVIDDHRASLEQVAWDILEVVRWPAQADGFIGVVGLQVIVDVAGHVLASDGIPGE